MTSRLRLKKEILSLFAIAVIFVAITYFTQQNIEIIKELLSRGGKFGFLLYILVTVAAIVAAPLTSIPLIPLVVQVWGVFLTGIFSIVGWTLGSLAAFWVARRFGTAAVSKVESLERIRAVAGRVPEKKMFWYLLFLRMTIPVDILSYALGLFTDISWRMFFATTLIGVIPVTFLLAYVGSLPVILQAPIVVAGVISIIALFLYHARKTR